MIELYHCVSARSFRALWMLEELDLPYQLHMLPFPPRALAKDYLAQNPLGTVTPEKARLDTTKRAAGENRGENNADSMDVEEAASPMEAFEGAANDGIRVDISSMTGDKETV